MREILHLPCFLLQRSQDKRLVYSFTEANRRIFIYLKLTQSKVRTESRLGPVTSFHKLSERIRNLFYE